MYHHYRKTQYIDRPQRHTSVNDRSLMIGVLLETIKQFWNWLTNWEWFHPFNIWLDTGIPVVLSMCYSLNSLAKPRRHHSGMNVLFNRESPFRSSWKTEKMTKLRLVLIVLVTTLWRACHITKVICFTGIVVIEEHAHWQSKFTELGWNISSHAKPHTTILISVTAIISNDFDVPKRQIKVLSIKVLQ